tara:strand:+ start:702 stop:1118 length:417 start_codon:yes stop_codon:yes gene_type:complete
MITLLIAAAITQSPCQDRMLVLAQHEATFTPNQHTQIEHAQAWEQFLNTLPSHITIYPDYKNKISMLHALKYWDNRITTQNATAFICYFDEPKRENVWYNDDDPYPFNDYSGNSADDAAYSGRNDDDLLTYLTYWVGG